MGSCASIEAAKTTAIVSQPEKPHKTPEDATRLQSDVKAGDSPREQPPPKQEEPHEITIPEPIKESLQAQTSMDDELAEVDRLLTATKSQLESRPLELGLEPEASIELLATSTPAQRSPTRTNTRSPTSIPDLLADSSDPWASLQSAYRIRDNAEPTSTQGKVGVAGAGTATSGKPWGRQGGVSPAHGRGGDGDGDVVLLDPGVQGGGLQQPQQPLYNQRPQARLAAKPSVAKNNGWGHGEMAAAGTLMVGDRELDDLMGLSPDGVGGGPPPPGAMQAAKAPGNGGAASGGARGGLTPEVAGDPELEMLRSRIKANGLVADLGVEDLEDLDDPFDSHMVGGSSLNPSLAAKLAKFEALADGDD